MGLERRFFDVELSGVCDSVEDDLGVELLTLAFSLSITVDGLVSLFLSA